MKKTHRCDGENCKYVPYCSNCVSSHYPTEKCKKSDKNDS